MIALRRRCGPLLTGLTSGAVLVGVLSAAGAVGTAAAAPPSAAVLAAQALPDVPVPRVAVLDVPFPDTPRAVRDAVAAVRAALEERTRQRAAEPAAEPGREPDRAVAPRSAAASGAGPGDAEPSARASAGAAASGGDPRAEVVALTNAEREDAGCDPLRTDTRLAAAAQGHAEDMAGNDFFSHTGRDGSDFADRARAEGHPSPGGENIAQGEPDAAAVVEAWMDSPGHRRNILDCSFASIGVGHAGQDDHWVQVFGR